ncbi:MAG: L-aspartate oxidase [Candidatus Hydrogenedentota bacterium]|nr:MAG: L-aspartate oxidase [Candidatus Hydrogenedentota bacterium]
MKDQSVDVLILGSGLAGLYYALHLPKDLNIHIVTKGKQEESATRRAQGGIAAAIGENDDWHHHYEDTLRAGAGLCDTKAVKILVTEGPKRIQDLMQLGLEFTRDKEGKLHLGREGGHGLHRVVHVADHTGKDLHNFLLKQIQKKYNVKIHEEVMAVDLITEHHVVRDAKKATTCYGAYLLYEKTGEVKPMQAKFTMLATGGAGQVYPFTTNPVVATGDGYAMAYRAGCRIRNMEFVQFHPTALYRPVQPAFLISEALRGYGAYLVDKQGKRFMPDFDSRAELAPRDIVARAIDTVLKQSGDECVFLDVRHKDAEETKKEFPLIYETLKHKFGIDMTQERIPVIPAAHYICGGIITDYDGKTDLKNLFCVGETASTGVHGGNRLASNSLLEALVFSYRAAQKTKEMLKQKKVEKVNIPDWDSTRVKPLKDKVIVRHDREEIQKLLWDYVGIVRSEERLEIALNRIDHLYRDILHFYRSSVVDRKLLELRNMALVAQLIVRCAVRRKESRGLHYVVEYPQTEEPSRKDTILTPEIFSGSRW